MTYVPNPFRSRLAEQQRDSGAFLRTFGAGMLDMLPDAETAWDRLIVLRSAPGAGKTSLLRMFTPQSLIGVTDNINDLPHLHAPLSRIGAVTGRSLTRLGILVSLGKDYRAVLDLGPGQGSEKVFFRLLNARIAVRMIESALAACGLRFPDDAHKLRFSTRQGALGQAARSALESLVSDTDSLGDLGQHQPLIDGEALLREARAHERDVLRLLDSLLPVDWSLVHGHARLYIAQFLSGAEISVEGRVLPRPVLLLDDVHDLADGQRRSLYAELMDRGLDVGRWVAERYAALRDDELLTDASPEGRDVVTIRLEQAMTMGSHGGRSRSPERVFSEIANSRARAPLSLAGYEDPFTALIRDRDDVATGVAMAASESVASRVLQLCSEHPRYTKWLEDAKIEAEPVPLRAAVRWRELRLLIERDLLKPAQTLFEEEPPERGYTEATGSSTRGAARLFLAREEGVPYYIGSSILADLASKNVEQYLTLAGGLFDLMLAAVTLKRHPALTAEEQDRHARAASRLLWEAVPERVSFGEDVSALLHAIAANSRSETYRPNAPYAPGVTGTAFPYFERSKLVQARSGGPARLSRAIAGAIAHNLLEVEQPIKTKNGTWTVLYLNRLLCPYFGLPLQRGGFREQRISKLVEWLERASAARVATALPDPEVPLVGVERVAV
jgi:hypothetical protein